MRTAAIGDEVLIFGGISHFATGRVANIHVEYTQPFALVPLYRRDGKLGQRRTLVPLARCASFGKLPESGGPWTRKRVAAWVLEAV